MGGKRGEGREKADKVYGQTRWYVGCCCSITPGGQLHGDYGDPDKLSLFDFNHSTRRASPHLTSSTLWV